MTIEISNQIKEIEEVHRQLNDYFIPLPLNEYDRKKIIISVDEILSNIISYGYRDDLHHTIEVKFESHPGSFRLEFTDDGIYFDPIHFIHHYLPKLQSDDNKTGGLGLHLVHRLMDDMHYHRSEEKNKLVLSLNYSKKAMDVKQ